MSDFGDQQDGPSASLASSRSEDDRRVDPPHDIDGDPTGSPTVGLTTFSRLQRGERFSLATGGGLIPNAGVDHEVPAPERLDAYEIVERLGEGGMGIVYLADQLEPVRRRVALKVSKSALADARAVHRFEAERQAMARLAHPYIAQIFAAGASEDGHPYFVMEHVDGRPITTYCDEHRLSLSDRLSLFRDVCAGVQHAHQKGILHRDIKPSNILVTEIDGRPVPKLIDFGIAKGLDAPLLQGGQATGVGLIGTPGYLSPERVQGNVDADTRSDVYALGVLLYELLVGVRPFDSGDTSAFSVLQRIANEDPQPPSRRWAALDEADRGSRAAARRHDPKSLEKRLRGDLDAIVVKAIAKAPNGRYDTAAALADDIDRFARHEPVAAGSAGGWYRFRKMMRRHRGAAAAGILLVLSLSAGLVLRTIEARRANREAETARQVTQFLVDMFEVADPQGEAGADVTARELLDRGARQLRNTLRDQPLIRAELLDTIGTVYRNLGLYQAAADIAQESLALRTALLPETHPGIVRSLRNLGLAQSQLGQSDKAEAALRQALAIETKTRGPRHVALAETLTHLGVVQISRDKIDEAAESLSRALVLRESSLGATSLEVAETLDFLAELEQRLAHFELAERHALRAMDIREEILGPDHTLVARSLKRLSRHYQRVDRYEEAAKLAHRVVAIAERTYGPESAELLTPLVEAGWSHYRGGTYAEAEQVLARAQEIAEQASDVTAARRGEILEALGAVAHGREQWTRCEGLFRQASVFLREAHGELHSNVAVNLNNIAACQTELQQFDKAEGSYRRAHEILSRVYGPDHPETALPWFNLAELQWGRGDLQLAETTYLQTLAIWQEAHGPEHSDVAYVLNGLGEVYRDMGRLDEAEDHYRRALAIRERILAPGSQDLRSTLKGLATVLAATGRATESEALLARIASPSPSPQ